MMRLIPILLTAAVLFTATGSVHARPRERRSAGLLGGSVGAVSLMYQNETGKNFNNTVTYTAGSWYGHDLSLAQQSRRYFGELYLRPVLGAGIMELLVNYRSRSSVLVGAHGIAGCEYSFNDKIFIGGEVLLHLVLFDIIMSGSNEGLGSYLGSTLFVAPGLYARYAF